MPTAGLWITSFSMSFGGFWNKFEEILSWMMQVIFSSISFLPSSTVVFSNDRSIYSADTSSCSGIGTHLIVTSHPASRRIMKIVLNLMLVTSRNSTQAHFGDCSN